MNSAEREDAKKIVALQEIKSLKNILIKGRFKVEISKSTNGARIKGEVDLSRMNGSLRDFVLDSFRNAGDKNIEIEIEGFEKSLKTKVFYCKDVSENYLNDEKLLSDAKRHVLKVFSNTLKTGVIELKESVKNKGFPVDKEKRIEPFKKDNKGAILRFIDKIRPSSCFGLN